MSDLIERQAAIDAILAVTGNSSVRELYEHVQEHGLSDMWSGGVNAAIDIIIAVPPVQPDTEVEIQKMQDLEQAQMDKAYELGYEEGKVSAQPEPCVDTIDALNESIKHFDDMAEECRRNANIERNDYMDMRDDAAEYRQLSIWLNELKWLRERFQSQPEPCEDCVSRKVIMQHYDSGGYKHVNHISRNGLLDYIEQLPSAQPTLYGYSIDHLAVIARVLQKENFPPERISEILSDVGRIVDMVRDEFEETLRKEVEQCTMT